MGITKLEREVLADAEQRDKAEGWGEHHSYDLRPLSLERLNRLYTLAHSRMSRGSGYQPFGFDWPTIRAVHPGWYSLLSSILLEGKRQLHS